jgi:HD-like signal output (HDOD) protein
MTVRKTILFVDDNPFILQLYTTAFEAEAKSWETTTAADAEQALECFKLRSFDVVVSDLRMPGMDGIELMTEISKRSPLSSRIIISGLDDQAEVVRGLNSTHQFLSKPIDIKALKNTLARISALDAYLKDEKLQKLLGQVRTLPTFPSVYVKVTQELGIAEPSLEKISEALLTDPSMTAKILQIVNSAAFGMGHRVSSLFEAVQLLGLGSVRSLVLSAHILAAFDTRDLKGFSITRLWEHGMNTAVLAKLIMKLEKGDVAELEEAFIAGMLHDIGQLILADNLSHEFQRVLELAEKRQVPQAEAEMELLGTTHAAVGAYLLGLWGLPAGIVEALAFHHTPGKSDSSEPGPLVAVHAADFLEHELHPGREPGSLPKLDMDYLERLGLTNRLDVWREAAREALRSDQM